ncbi:unnamed protein product [Cuscuta campestris]|uniref:Uncharacterized protein n=1 Tax=Cuscuta campestris TaxID=132261 RepID=A0A484MXM8_9ASTE|nr:unnamed protein product [Cuscuta campestris]
MYNFQVGNKHGKYALVNELACEKGNKGIQSQELAFNSCQQSLRKPLPSLSECHLDTSVFFFNGDAKLFESAE